MNDISLLLMSVAFFIYGASSLRKLERIATAVEDIAKRISLQ